MVSAGTGGAAAPAATTAQAARTARTARGWWRAYSEEESGVATAVVLLVVGAGTLALGLVDLWTDVPWSGRATDVAVAWHLLPLAVGCAGLLLRRRRPAVSLVVAAAAFVGDGAIGGSLAVALVLFDATFAVERFGSARARAVIRWGVGVVTAGTVVAGALDQLPLRLVIVLGLQTLALLALPIWWASNVRQKTELAEAAQARADLETARAGLVAERAAAGERARSAERRSAVQAERSQMARELHDAVAGDVTAVVIRSGAALAAPAGTDLRPSLTAIRESGLHALTELRSMIEVLHADEPVSPVAPTLTAAGAALLERSGAVRQGDLPTQLPDGVDRAAYRILQEALTNAGRHGDGDPARVLLRHGDGVLVVGVENGVLADEPSGTGLGLVSMGERAAAVGGTLAAGPRGGRWHVRAELPTTVEATT